MGYLLFESSHKLTEVQPNVKGVLTPLSHALKDAGKDADGKVEIEIIVRGNTEKTVQFSLKNSDELIEILKLNAE